MFSADNTGVINVWKTSVNGSKQRQHPCQLWSIEMVPDTDFIVKRRCLRGVDSLNRGLSDCSHGSKGFVFCVALGQKIDESDLRGIPINRLQLHPNGRCLLIHAKDSALRMMDLRM